MEDYSRYMPAVVAFLNEVNASHKLDLKIVPGFNYPILDPGKDSVGYKIRRQSILSRIMSLNVDTSRFEEKDGRKILNHETKTKIVLKIEEFWCGNDERRHIPVDV